LDELTAFNKERWEALAAADVEWSRPFLDLDLVAARKWLEGEGAGFAGGLEDLERKHVLCLAGGGGQQSAVFGVLGAHVTVLDFSETQLDRDMEAAKHYGYSVRLERGDMRDLSRFSDGAFDIVWHPYSISFIPDPKPVFWEAARVLRAGGTYRLEFANPFIDGLNEEDWDGRGYPLRRTYITGAELVDADPNWDIFKEDGSVQRIVGPREFRHTLSSVLNELIGLGFCLLGISEGPIGGDPRANAGTWQHFITVAPPWLSIWALMPRK
jgi:SAM-dependent methyltransferase